MKLRFNQGKSRYYSTKEYFELVCDDLGWEHGEFKKSDVAIAFEGEMNCEAKVKLRYERDADRTLQTSGDCPVFYSQLGKSWEKDKVVLHAAYPKLHKRYLVPEVDVITCGRMYEHRSSFLKGLAEKVNISIFADGKSPKEYVKVLNTGRILFNYSDRGEISRKPFEYMSIGCLVTDKVEGLEMVGEEGKHFFTYNRKDINDAARVINELLSKPSLVTKVHEQSSQHVKKNHTYKHRLRELLKKGGYYG